MMKKILKLILSASFLLSGVCIANDLSDFKSLISMFEKKYHTHIGIYAIDKTNDLEVGFNYNTRVPFCSAGKVMVVATMLKQSETNINILNKKIKILPDDIKHSGYAPITSKFVGKTMTLSDLAKASLQYSDNLAMNLLIDQVGGVNKVNNFAKSIGDKYFRLDRKEPFLNSAIPGDWRDTTTPLAMSNTLDKLLLGNFLAYKQQNLLKEWMISNTTGGKRIRAALSANAIVADKTGTGENGTINDVGIVWYKSCHPIIISIFTTSGTKSANKDEMVIVDVTKTIIEYFAKKNKCLKS